jgi:hypothetical protein
MVLTYSCSPTYFRVQFLGSDRLPYCDSTLVNSFSGGTNINFPLVEGVRFKVNYDYRGFGPYGTEIYVIENITSGTPGFTAVSESTGLPIPNYNFWYMQQACDPQSYYTNEKIKFRVYGPSPNSNGGNYCWDVQSFVFKILSPTGVQTRTAILNEDDTDRYYNDSVYGNGRAYWTFEYTIQGSDVGTIKGPDSTYITNYTDIKIVDNCNGLNNYYDYCSVSPALLGYTAVGNARINVDGQPGRLSSHSTILLKRSPTPDKQPLASDLILGEVALNTNDAILFTKKENNTVVPIKDVLEYADPSKFPVPGQKAKLYISKNDNKLSRWDGSQYVEVSSIQRQVYSVSNYSISSSQNNFDIGASAVIRVSATTTGLSITGFKSGTDGEIRMLYNGGTNAFNLSHNSASSSSGNKFLIYNSTNFNFQPNIGVTILYDGTSGAWRLFS